MSKMIDLTGQKYGNLYVVKADRQAKDYQTIWECKCDCGNTCFVRGYALTSGKTKSCGCARHTASQFRFKDLTGERFGYLTVIGFDHKGDDYKSYFKVRCDCGKEIIVQGYQLTSGHTKSCGCKKGEMNGEVHKKHSRSGSRIYRIWCGIKNRCLNTHLKVYPLYGGRGIKICDEWIGDNGFQNFYDWAMANGYDDTLTIDRVDNDKGYSPDNCRWVDMKIQSNNTRRNVCFEYNGETLTISQIARKYNMPYKLLYKRLHNFGWTVEEAVNKPKQ